MKKLIFVALMLMAYAITSGQTITVINKSNLQPIQGATVSGNKGNTLLITDSKGRCDLKELSGADTLFFNHISFKPMLLPFKDAMQDGQVKLTEQYYNIEEMIVSASRFEEKKKDVAQSVEVITSDDIAFSNPQTSADVLQQSGNVFVQKSQMGGGSPILRGFEANRVLIVVDGVRMNNAIYRGGHLQNVITLDNTAMDRVEVVFGPGSVVYGSDALGGVMHFHTKDPILGNDEGKYTRTNAFMRFASANTESTGHVDFNLGGKKLASFTSINFSRFGDLRQGSVRNPFYDDFGKKAFVVEQISGMDSAVANSDPNVQNPTGYSQVDIFQKLLYKSSDHLSHLANIQFSTSTDIPRYDRLTQVSGNQPKYAQWYYGAQQRFLASYGLKYSRESGLFDHLSLIAAYQNIEESRHDRKFRSDQLNHRNERLNVYTLNLDLDKKLNRNEIRYGMEGTYNEVSSTAHSENIQSGAMDKLDSRYPDGGSVMSSAAAFVSHAFEISPKWILNDGLRISAVSLQSTFTDTSFYAFPYKSVKQENTALNGSLGLVYFPGKDWRFNMNASSGFRAPNVDDLSKVFESVPGNIVVPNAKLKPEYTYNLDLGFSKVVNKTVTLGATGFYTWYVDAITTLPGKFNGKDSIMYDGQLSRVTMNTNAAEAYIYGFNAFFNAEVNQNLSFYNTINYTYGRYKTDSSDYPLDHIPPVYGKSGFVLVLDKFKSDFFVMYNGWKRLSSYNVFGEDNINSATSQGMPAWFTLNLRTAYQLNKVMQCQFAVENILDQNYRVFASGISAPGRNFIVTLRASF